MPFLFYFLVCFRKIKLGIWMSETLTWVIYISLFIIFLLILVVVILEIISGLKLQNIKQQAEPVVNDLQKLGVAAQDLKNELSKTFDDVLEGIEDVGNKADIIKKEFEDAICGDFCKIYYDTPENFAKFTPSAQQQLSLLCSCSLGTPSVKQLICPANVYHNNFFL